MYMVHIGWPEYGAYMGWPEYGAYIGWPEYGTYIGWPEPHVYMVHMQNIGKEITRYTILYGVYIGSSQPNISDVLQPATGHNNKHRIMATEDVVIATFR